MSQFPTCRVLFSCLALASVVARAEPLDLSRVPAKAVWFMHADIDAARESTVINRMYERAMKMHPRLEQMMTLATGMVGMDPRKDLHDITVYGLDTDKKNAVMIVQAAANREGAGTRPRGSGPRTYSAAEGVTSGRRSPAG